MGQKTLEESIISMLALALWVTHALDWNLLCNTGSTSSGLESMLEDEGGRGEVAGRYEAECHLIVIALLKQLSGWPSDITVTTVHSEIFVLAPFQYNACVCHLQSDIVSHSGKRGGPTRPS